jgi:hypothetical protein
MFKTNIIQNIIIRTLTIVCMILFFYFIAEGLRIDQWTYAIFTFQLILMALILQFAIWIIRKLEITRFLVNILLEYIAVIFVVIGLGFLFRWYNKDTFYIVFLILTVVFIITYALGLLKTRSDVMEINDLLISRNKN